MPKILITGMNRSGTTLAGDLLSRHPAVKHVFHESTLLHQSREAILSAKVLPDNEMIQTKGELTRARNVKGLKRDVEFDLGTDTWGAKMSYPGPVILQEWCGRTDAYVQRWLDYFGSEARVVHILRHPFDVFCSARSRWASDPGHLSNYGPVSLDNVCRDWAFALEELLPFADKEQRFMNLRYEDVVKDPQVALAKMYAFCELPEPEKSAQETLAQDLVFFGDISKDRIARHRRETLEPISRSTAFLLRGYFERLGYTHDSVNEMVKG